MSIITVYPCDPGRKLGETLWELVDPEFKRAEKTEVGRRSKNKEDRTASVCDGKRGLTISSGESEKCKVCGGR